MVNSAGMFLGTVKENGRACPRDSTEWMVEDAVASQGYLCIY